MFTHAGATKYLGGHNDVLGGVLAGKEGLVSVVRDLRHVLGGVLAMGMLLRGGTMRHLLAFAAVYLLVIGPIDYFVLKLLRRQTLTWITFPVSIVVFSALALVGTSYVKGSQAVVTSYEIVDVLPGTDLWRGVSWYGVWSTRSTPLSMTSGEGDGVAEIREGAGYKTNVETVHGTAGSALTWDAQTWTLAYARTTWTAPGKGTFSAARLGDGSVEIKNDTNYGLTDVVVDFPNSRATLPSLGPGETRTVSPTGMQRPYPLDYPPEELELDSESESELSPPQNLDACVGWMTGNAC